MKFFIINFVDINVVLKTCFFRIKLLYDVSIVFFIVKNIIQDDRGFKVCGTAVADKDERVSFMARIEPSKDDSKFGFYKRPTKVKVE